MSSVVIAGNTSGTVTLNAPDVAGTTVVNLPANSMNMGNGGGNVSSNTALGASALNANTTGNSNTAIGYQTLLSNTTGTDNVALGAGSLYTNVSGQFNVGVGSDTLKVNTVSNNTAVGTSALRFNTTGTPNNAFGYQALYSNTTGSRNTAIGTYALFSQTTGYQNIAIGQWAGYYVTGQDNIGIGVSALSANTAGGGSYNVAIGTTALFSNTTGESNVAVGYQALQNNTTGYQNVAVGPQALPLSLGNYNVGIGSAAGYLVTTGGTNTFVGYAAGQNTTTGSNNICIGTDAKTQTTGSQYNYAIGVGISGQGDNTFTFGKAANLVYNTFTVNATWTRTSDERLKTDIQNDPLGLDFITKLRPVTYRWKPSNEVPQELTDHYTEENVMDTDSVMNGFIAQEVKSALEAVGNPVFGGWTVHNDGAQAISREMFIMPLVNAVKELAAKVEALEAQLASK